MGCGCQARREWLNERHEGLGDRVATVAEPVKEMIMKGLLRPDGTALVAFVLGAFVLPVVLAKIRAPR